VLSPFHAELFFCFCLLSSEDFFQPSNIREKKTLKLVLELKIRGFKFTLQKNITPESCMFEGITLLVRG